MSANTVTYSSFQAIINSGSLQVIQATKGLMVTAAGTLAVGGAGGTIINYGSIGQGALLPFAVTQIGAANTCQLIALR